eukprot:CAMPEP_0195508260 /NCGR_PEP_ID=MMETSP0794_2-20130614/1513_1 /TAXON_ID=515487 /ORGANISM="Stephanopyxis turris, Strain CCMP 815" /LENGTH=504 /DNA_ID=CAMNT_0040635171 /DNA_START=182 /DNA_END=1699 /DNA_ORIENTATION=-
MDSVSSEMDNTESITSTPWSTTLRRKCYPCIKSGTKSGATLNLCSATLGAGILAIPYAFSKSGLIIGVVLLGLAVWATILTCDMLVISTDEAQLHSYEEMASEYFHKCVGYVVEFFIISFCFGCAVAFIIALGDILEEAVLSFDRSPEWLTRNAAMGLFWLVALFPLSLIKKVDSLRFPSLFGVISVFFLAFVVTYHAIRTVDEKGFDLSWGMPPNAFKYWPESFYDVLLACPIFMFAFSSQVNLFEIYDGLTRKSPDRMSVVTRCAFLICGINFLFAGVFGYFEFGQTTQGNILKNYCTTDTKDPLIIAAHVCVAVAITSSYPLNITPCRVTIQLALLRIVNDWTQEDDCPESAPVDAEHAEVDEPLLDWNDDPLDQIEDSESNETNSKKHTNAAKKFSKFMKESILWHIAITLLISGGAFGVALAVPNLALMFGIIGGTAVAFLSFILPAVYYLKVVKTKRKIYLKISAYLLIVFGILIGITSTAITIHSIGRDDSPESTCS